MYRQRIALVLLMSLGVTTHATMFGYSEDDPDQSQLVSFPNGVNSMFGGRNNLGVDRHYREGMALRHSKDLAIQALDRVNHDLAHGHLSEEERVAKEALKQKFFNDIERYEQTIKEFNENGGRMPLSVRKLLARGFNDGLELGVERAAQKSVENAIKAAMGDSLNNALSYASRTVFGTVRGCWDFIYKWMTWRSGRPFDVEELAHMQQSLCDCLDDLYSVAQKSSKVAGRDKELRVQLDEEDIADPAWKWQRDCIENELRFVTMYLDAGLVYYSKNGESDRKIRFYTEQLRNWIENFVEHMLLSTKSGKDTGSSNFMFALMHLRNNIDRTFTNLIMQVSPTFFMRDDKGSKNQPGGMMRRGGRGNAGRRNMMGGMMPNYDPLF